MADKEAKHGAKKSTPAKKRGPDPSACPGEAPAGPCSCGKSDLPAFPSPFLAEQVVSDLDEAGMRRKLDDTLQLNLFLAGRGKERRSEQAAALATGADPASASDPARAAQDLAYQAMEKGDTECSRDLVRQALKLDPGCVDARVLQATSHRFPITLARVLRALQEAVAIAEERLGKKYLAEHTGSFWGLTRTRPYMRARLQWAEAIYRAGRLSEAIAHYEQLLELNPRDNQGVRNLLLSAYLETGQAEACRRLLDQYGDHSAIFLWSAVLERFLAKDEAGLRAALKEAREQNRFVEPFLSGKKPVPAQLPGYYSQGDRNEAVISASLLGEAWKKHPAAGSWLGKKRS